MSFVATPESNVEGIVSENIVWYLDSGATDHMTNQLNILSDVEIINPPIKIHVAKDGLYLLATSQQ